MHFKGELVLIMVIAYQTFSPVIKFKKKCSRIASKNDESQGQRAKRHYCNNDLKAILCNHLNLF